MSTIDIVILNLLTLLNLSLIIAYPILLIIALRRIGQARLSPAIQIIWALIVILIPVLGALAAIFIILKSE